MKSVFRNTLSAVICVAVLGACAPAKRNLLKPATGTGAAPTDISQQTPTAVQGNIIRAEANLPVTSGSNGTVSLIDNKGNASVINLDNSLNATSSNLTVSTKPTCATTGATTSTTLDKCADITMGVTLAAPAGTGTTNTTSGTTNDSQGTVLTVEIHRRSNVNVTSTLTLPNAQSTPETNQKFGTASHVLTLVKDSTNKVTAFDSVMILVAGATDADTLFYDGKILTTEDPTQQVRFVVKGSPQNLAGTKLSLNPTKPEGKYLDGNKNLTKSFNVSAGTTVETLVITVVRFGTDGTSAAGSTDLTNFKIIPPVSAQSTQAQQTAATDAASKVVPTVPATDPNRVVPPPITPTQVQPGTQQTGQQQQSGQQQGGTQSAQTGTQQQNVQQNPAAPTQQCSDADKNDSSDLLCYCQAHTCTGSTSGGGGGSSGSGTNVSQDPSLDPVQIDPAVQKR